MAYSQHDDSFFIESDEPQQRLSARSAAKIHARNRQDLIACELSRLAGEEYLEDIMQHMRHMEACTNRNMCLPALYANFQNRTRHSPMPTSSICNARSSGSCALI